MEYVNEEDEAAYPKITEVLSRLISAARWVTDIFISSADGYERVMIPVLVVVASGIVKLILSAVTLKPPTQSGPVALRTNPSTGCVILYDHSTPPPLKAKD